MSATPRTTNAERAGRWLGRTWRGVVRREARVIRWLAGKGLPVGRAGLVLWIVKLAIFGVLLYAAFWLALLLLVVAGAAWVARTADLSDDDEEPEWRNGWEGYGLYRGGVRIDMGGTDDE